MFNERIKELRIARNLTQVQLANKLSVTKQAVSNWENDNILPSITMLERIAGYFSVSTDCILGIDTKKYIEVSGLDDVQIAHVQMIINDIRKS